MPSETVLITGSTGHVGYAVLLAALKKGYRVRAAVRSDAKAEQIKAAPSTKPYLSQLDFVIVKDITQDGAFDQAVKGIDAVLHVASPIPSANVKDFEEDLIRPAVHGTTSILYSALKEKSIRRVVITSSIAAVFDGSDQLFTPDKRLPEFRKPYDTMMDAYRASKIAAHNTVDRFIEEKKPHFSIINIMPGYVIGKNELATTPEEIDGGSNAAMLTPILGRQGPPTMLCVVHVDDVAFLHVASLDPKVEGNRNFGANYDYKSSFVWNHANSIVEKHFPEAVKNGTLPLGGSAEVIPVPFDGSESERVFNFKFKTPEEMIKNIVGYYVQAVEKRGTKP